MGFLKHVAWSLRYSRAYFREVFAKLYSGELKRDDAYKYTLERSKQIEKQR